MALHNIRNLSPQEAHEFHVKGGKASKQKQKENKLLKDELLKRMNAKDWDELTRNLIERAKLSSKDLVVLRDTIGQKPVEHVEAVVEETIIDVSLTD